MDGNPVADLVIRFQELVGQVPDVLQPLIIALAGAVPFIEGEGATAIAAIGGLHPVVGGLAAAMGNFLCVTVVVLLGARARRAVVARVAHAAAEAPAGTEPTAKPRSKGRERLNRWLVRFGVPGASLLAPLALPTHFTAATLVGAGIPARRVLFWQAMAILLWTTLVTVSAMLAIAVATS
jgi:hypothetical protein